MARPLTSRIWARDWPDAGPEHAHADIEFLRSGCTETLL